MAFPGSVMLTPGYNPMPYNYGIGSTLKSLSFLLLFAGTILITMGYSKQQGDIPPKVEYRHIPRSFEEEQVSVPPLLSIYGNMFGGSNVFNRNYGFAETQFPWQRQMINSRIVLPYSLPLQGLNRAVGQQVLGQGLTEGTIQPNDGTLQTNRFGPRGLGTRALG